MEYVAGKMRHCPSPIYAEPGKMPSSIIEELAARFSKYQSDSRRVAQHRRWQILNNQHEELIKERVNETQKTEVADLIGEHVSTVHNPAEDQVKDLCVVWRKGIVRRISGVEDSSKSSSAFHRLVQETKLDAIAPTLNRIGWFVGPVTVLPQLRRGKLRFEVIQPHTSEVILDPYDPLGDPVAVAFSVAGNYEADFCVVDGHSRRYFKIEHQGPVEITRLREVHNETGEPFFPGSVCRFEVPLEANDWHCAWRHRRLVDGAVDVGRIAAHRDYVRRVQSRMLLIVAGDLTKLAKGQNLSDPEKPLLMHIGNNNGADVSASFNIETLPFSQDPSHFQADVRDKVEAMARSTGVQYSIEMSGDGGALAVFDFGALTEFRSEQIAHAREFEKALWSRSCEYARRMRHPLAGELPTAEEVEQGLRIEFGRLSRKSSDPREERDAMDWRLSKGAMSFLDVIREDYPNLDDDGLREILETNIEENTTFWNAVASRNATLNPQTMAVQDASQAYGAMGTPARDAGKPKPNDSNERPEQ